MAVQAPSSRYLPLLLCLVTACGDDAAGSDSGDGSSGSGSTSTATTTTSSSTGGESTEGPGTSTGSTVGTSTGSPGTSSTESDSSTSSTTGSEAVEIPFTLHDTSMLELTTRVPEGWVLVTTAAEWAGFSDAPAPVTFPDRWVLFGSRGPQPFPGNALTVDTLTWQGGTLEVAGEQVGPAEDCETYDFIWPADTLLSFDALDHAVDAIDDQTLAAEFSCARGAGDSEDCDSTTACATGSLCAGLIRSTVLVNDPGGFCLDAGYRGSFSGGAVTIPANGTTAEVELDVAGLTSVDMDVTILLDLNHPAPEELVVTLRNPDGNEVTVADQQTTPLHPGGVPIVPTGFSGDESVNGTWVLVVRDAVDNANEGSVEGWTLEIMSRFD